MHKTKKQCLPIVALAALLTVILIGSTWAYWTQQLEVVNEYKTGIYKTELIDDFVSPDGWLPGAETNKDVFVRNKGTVPVFVKAVINQQWVRRENILDGDGNIISPAKGEKFGLCFEADNGLEYAALIKWGRDVALLSTGVSDNPSLSLGLPTVNTPGEAKGKWLLLNETPDREGNYTFYYIGIVEAGKETPLLVDSVAMNPKIKAAITSKSYYYDNETEEWKTIYIKNKTYDYECARYTMNITVNTVQATEAAVKEVFTVRDSDDAAVRQLLTTYAITGSDIDPGNRNNINKLYFREDDGVMSYTTDGSVNSYLFMSFLNMIPGESYTDALIIKNESKKTFDLYMQAIPLEQEDILNKLLELISMKVYLGGKLIYNGTAMGKEYSFGTANLQDVISLGTFQSGDESSIDVKLTLSKDTGMEYCDLLTKIDWRFMVTETANKVIPPNDTTNPKINTPDTNPKTPQTVTPQNGTYQKNTTNPKTGYEDNRVFYLLLMFGSMISLGALIWYEYRRRGKQPQ